MNAVRASLPLPCRLSHDITVNGSISRSRRRRSASVTSPNTVFGGPSASRSARHRRVVLDELAGRVVEVVAALGDGQRDDPRLRRGELLEHRLGVVGRVQVLDQRADRPRVPRAVGVLDDQRVAAVLLAQDVAHLRVGLHHADPADAPVERLALVHEAVVVHRHVRAMEAADAEVHHPGRHVVARVLRARNLVHAMCCTPGRREQWSVMRFGMLVIAMTVLLGTTVGWAKAPRASTAATCGGKLIASLPIKNGGKRIGSLVVYEGASPQSLPAFFVLQPTSMMLVKRFLHQLAAAVLGHRVTWSHAAARGRERSVPPVLEASGHPTSARGASGSCCVATCRARPAAASTPAARTRPRSARPTSRPLVPHRDGHLAACHHPRNV